jgi:hypothetical protein
VSEPIVLWKTPLVLAWRTLRFVDILPGFVTTQDVVHLLSLQYGCFLHLPLHKINIRARLAKPGHSAFDGEQQHVAASWAKQHFSGPGDCVSSTP